MKQPVKQANAAGSFFAMQKRKGKRSEFSMDEFMKAVEAGDRETVVRLLAALKKRRKSIKLSLNRQNKKRLPLFQCWRL